MAKTQYYNFFENEKEIEEYDPFKKFKTKKELLKENK